MANIKISELNELLTGERAYDDYLPIVDSSANETKKVSVKNLIPNNVELIAVTDTAPTLFGTGDKYYNTTTNRIYTARSGEWISPEEPIKGILYVILEDQKTFTYDEYNETLVSVGGGGGGGIAVYPDEPEEDTKLYIEEEDLDGQYLPVDEDIYSTTETKTNKVWIDGKPIYRTVVEIQSLPNATSGTYAHGISNIDDIVDIKGRYRISGQNQWYPIIYLNSGANFNNSVGMSIDATNISIYTGATDRRTWNAKIIIEYTKTS